MKAILPDAFLYSAYVSVCFLKAQTSQNTSRGVISVLGPNTKGNSRRKCCDLLPLLYMA